MFNIQDFILPPGENILNSTIFCFIFSIGLIGLFFLLSLKIKVIQVFFSKIFLNILNTINPHCKIHRGASKFVFFCIMIICTNNLLGLLPWFSSFTGFFVYNLAFCLLCFVFVIFAGLKQHGFGFFKKFVPNEIPKIVLPLITSIELISFFTRPFTLSLRLFMNVSVGHLLLHIMEEMETHRSIALNFIGILLSVIIYFFEIFSSLFQTYIFFLMMTNYINEATGDDH